MTTQQTKTRDDYLIGRATVDDAGDGVLILNVEGVDLDGALKSISILVRHPGDAKAERHGQLELNRLMEACRLSSIDDSSELLGRTIYANAWDSFTPKSAHGHERYIYVISCTDAVLCKIGVAGSPEKRLRQLSTASPHSLRLDFARLVPDAVKLERQAHDHFATSRCNGEWFAVPPLDAIVFVNQLADVSWRP